MANNCLVTKLKGIVDNNNLVKLNELKFHVKNEDETEICPLYLTSSSPITIAIIGNGHMYKGTINNQTDITTKLTDVTSTQGYRLSPGEYDVSIVSKYILKKTLIGSTTTTSEPQNIYITPDLFKYIEGITTFEVSGHGVTGNTEEYANCLPSGITWNGVKTEITGDIKYLAKFNLPLKLAGKIINNEACISDKLTGNIENFVRELISANYGKTFKVGPNKVKINGNYTLTASIVVDASGNATVYNDSAPSVILGTYTKATDTWTY